MKTTDTDTVTLTFKRFPEHKPQVGEEVLLLSQYSARVGVVKALYDVFDEEGFCTGEQIPYEEGKPQQRNTTICYYLVPGRYPMIQSDLWISSQEVQDTLKENS